MQSGNLLRHISPDSCQRECLFLMLERYTRFTLLNDHSFTAPTGVLLSLWLQFSIDVLWCQPYNHPRQHLIQRQKTNCFLFISYKLSVLNDINLESACPHSVSARCQSSSCHIHTACHHIHIHSPTTSFTFW